MSRRSRRRRRLIKPQLQLKIVSSFVLLAAISTLLQGLLLARALQRQAGASWESEQQMLAEAGGLVRETLVFGFALSVPLFLVVGIVVTFRIAGPIYRFERYFEALGKNGYTGACRIRQTDELHDLCNAINQGLEGLRANGVPDEAAEEGEPAEAAA